jgi:hypothetical protein
MVEISPNLFTLKRTYIQNISKIVIPVCFPQALTKLRKSLRDKKSSSSAALVSSGSTGSSPSKSKFYGHAPPLKGASCFGASREELAPREDEIQVPTEFAPIQE